MNSPEQRSPCITILGIDPGIANCGYAVVARNPRRGPAFCLRDIGCIVTPSSSDEASRLLTIYQKITEIIGAHHPNILAIERVFHNKNISSSLSVAKAIGVVQLAAAQAGIPVMLLTPQQLKAFTRLGGGASKSQVKLAAERLCGVKVRNLHAVDAVLCAIGGCLRAGK